MSTCKASLSRPGSICSFILRRPRTVDGLMAFCWSDIGFMVYLNICAVRRVYRMKNEVRNGNRDLVTPGDCSHDTYGLGVRGRALQSLSHPTTAMNRSNMT